MASLEQLKPGATKIIETCLALKSGESLLIVADEPNQNVADALYDAGKRIGAETVIVMMSPREAHGENPPFPIVEAMKHVDAAVLATSFSLSNSQARRDANENGVRIISIPGCCNEVLCCGGIHADFLELSSRVKALGDKLSNASEIVVTSKSGTQLNIGLVDRMAVNQTCLAHEKGSWSPAPLVESAIGPDQSNVNGEIVVDGVLIPGGIPDEPVILSIKNGKIDKICGGEHADSFRDMLKGYDNPDVFQLVEVGFGLNPEAEMGHGLMADDESEYGTIHFGFGEGRTFGLPVSAPCHCDVVIKNPTVELDGKLLLDSGEYLGI